MIFDVVVVVVLVGGDGGVDVDTGGECESADDPLRIVPRLLELVVVVVGGDVCVVEVAEADLLFPLDDNNEMAFAAAIALEALRVLPATVKGGDDTADEDGFSRSMGGGGDGDGECKRKEE